MTAVELTERGVVAKVPPLLHDPGMGLDRVARGAMVIALILVWIAALLLGGNGFAFDRGVLSALYAGGHPWIAGGTIALTQLGDGMALIPLGLAGAAALVIRRRRRDAILLMVIIGGGRILVDWQKMWVGRPRPPASEHLVAVSSASFPSAHAANATITCLALALLLFRWRGATGMALLLALLIGISRVALGVHWPSDVIGGWAFGLAWTIALIGLRGGSTLEKRPY